MTDEADGHATACPECELAMVTNLHLGSHLLTHHIEYTGHEDLAAGDLEPGDMSRLVAFDHALNEEEMAAVMQYNEYKRDTQ
jgi:hypothetical protein